MKKKEVKTKREMNAKTAVEILEDLVRSFKEGTVCIQDGDEFVTLKPTDGIEMVIEASEKKGKQKLEISLSWREMMPEDKEERAFRITSEEPKIETREFAPGTEPSDTESGGTHAASEGAEASMILN